MKLLRLHIVRLLLMALVVLSATTSCYNYDRPEVEMTEMAPASRYINITVAVSTSDQRVTRALPKGGEYGDGAEKGSAAENKVNNITLIFYEDATGVNTSSDDARVACVKSYAVTPVSYSGYHEHKEGETNDVKTNEVLYTTGDQRLDETTLQVGHTYKVIVAANVSLKVNVGDKIKTVRDTIFTNALYNVDDGTPTDFVMTSESDATVSLTNATQPSPNENRFVYNFNCIHIERMAARIDFWTKNSNGYMTSANDSRYTVPGYEYTVKKPDGSASADRFVLTRITPFNLNNGGEYMLKRTNDDTNPYLANETTTNWVVDPNTSGKNGSAHPSYLVSKLNDVVTTFENTFTVTMANLYEKTDKTGEDTLIVAYTKENTLRSDATTPLYYYATGLAFEGYYYAAGETQGVPRVYYYFIRHQGESNAAYNTWTPDNINDTKTTVCPSSTAMNFGIVRNNIYRISIETITEDARIKVKMWDVFTHSTIYM